MERKHWIVTGRVQGVGFRAWAAYQAHQLGLAGWVRNADDGSVEVEAQGSGEAIAELDRRLARGPRHADVVTCTMLSSTAEDTLPDPFETRRS